MSKNNILINGFGRIGRAILRKLSNKKFVDKIYINDLNEDFDILLAGAYSQSNWCRQITAAARKLEKDVMLVLVHGEKGAIRQGNLLLNELMGAMIKIVNIPDIQELPPYIYEEAKRLEKEGRRPFIIDPFDQNILAQSTIGYLDASIELDNQLKGLNLNADYIFFQSKFCNDVAEKFLCKSGAKNEILYNAVDTKKFFP